jgi:translocation protein SEC63
LRTFEFDTPSNVSTYRCNYLNSHPDKVAESEKEASQAQFVEISKAYNVLTDEEARKIFDEFGHPDGKQCMSMIQETLSTSGTHF